MMQDQELDDVKQEKDLNVIITNNLKIGNECTAACASKKMNMMYGLIPRNFYHKSQEIMKKIYTALLRPHLQERLKRRAIKHIPTL